MTLLKIVGASAIQGIVIAISYMPCDHNRGQDINEVSSPTFAVASKPGPLKNLSQEQPNTDFTGSFPC